MVWFMNMSMRFFTAIFLLFFMAGVSAFAQNPTPSCENIEYKKQGFTVCHYNLTESYTRLFLKDKKGDFLRTFSNLAGKIAAENQRLVFAMNGGMYHADREPAGLYVEAGLQTQRLNTNKGPGNFHMMPNGVFYITNTGAGVQESHAFAAAKHVVRYATQSGPMLVIDGKLHPKFNEGSISKYIRNGVGIRGDTLYFAISNLPVNFHTFASLFKERLQTDNALYLDGSVSKLYAPEIGRHDVGRAMGPMIAIVEKIVVIDEVPK